MTHSAENDALRYVPGEKCPLSGAVVSFTKDEWIEGEQGRCHGCGGMTRISVRQMDLFPWARALTHKVPRVIPPGEGDGS
jgi:hypothetical protein